MSNELSMPEEIITSKIYLIRGQKVMLDHDLAELYQVETKRINEQIKRNKERFPNDFMFQLSREEWANLKSQFATSSWGGRRTLPYVFTEHGVLMLSSVLKSDRAIAVNIHIMRVYTKLRDMIIAHKDLLLEFEEIKKRISSQDDRIDLVFDYLTKFLTEEEQKEPIRRVGFKTVTGN
ncbi:MAG: hypothetical protein ACI8ZM_000334 [Crocinitomix sp.]|jgi:hypothetical protein